MKTKLTCGVTVWGHGGGIHGSISEGVTTRDGRHALAFNFNGDWSGDTAAVIEAEFCGKGGKGGKGKGEGEGTTAGRTGARGPNLS